MAGDFDLRLGEDVARDFFQRGGKRRIQAIRGDFALNHRNGCRQGVFFQDPVAQHLGGVGRAGELGPVGEAVAIHVYHQQTPAAFGGHVRHRHVGQLEGAAQEFDRVDYPAEAVFLILLALNGRQLDHDMRIQSVAAPRRQGDRLLVGAAPIREGEHGRAARGA